MYAAIVFLPIIGSAIAGLLGRVIGARASEIVTTGLLFVSAALSIVAFNDVALGGHHYIIQIMPWIHSGDFAADWTVRIDALTAVMLVVVTGVSSLVHLYSIGYMAEDPHRPRFFSFLSLFTFAMLALVTANNFLQLFFGWEGVGLASYLLDRFLVHAALRQCRGDQGLHRQPGGRFRLRAGHFRRLCRVQDARLRRPCSRPRPRLPTSSSFSPAIRWTFSPRSACFCSWARWASRRNSGLHTWLPDAMEGPTPVSALIHAATMVTAGVFMVCRCSPLFQLRPMAAAFVTFIGAHHGLVRGYGRPGPERHQAGDRLFDLFAARLHVRRRRRRRLSAPPCSTSSPTPSSRRCCSWPPAR